MAQLVRRVSGLPRGIDNPRRVTERFPDTREGRQAADGWAKGLDDPRTFYDVRTRIDGRVVTKSFTTRKAAHAWATQIAHDKLTGVAIDPRSGDELFAHYSHRWLDTRRVKGRPLAPKTLELYGVLLRAHIEPTFSRRQLSAITPEAVRRWHAKVSSDSSAMSAAKSYRLLRAILATAVADGLIQANPCRVRGAGIGALRRTSDRWARAGARTGGRDRGAMERAGPPRRLRRFAPWRAPRASAASRGSSRRHSHRRGADGKPRRRAPPPDRAQDRGRPASSCSPPARPRLSRRAPRRHR